MSRFFLVALVIKASAFAAAPATQSPSSTDAMQTLTAPAASLPTTSTATLAPPTQKTRGWVADIDLRPSYGNSSAVVSAENYIEGGYQFNPSVKISLGHLFTIKNQKNQQNQAGVTYQPSDSFIRGTFASIWENSSGLSLSYQPRLMLPTDPDAAGHGFVAAIRNYFTLSQTFGSVKLSLSEVPVIYSQYKSGYLDSTKGEQVANTLFDNRVYLVADWSITDKLSLSVPIMFYNERKANYAPSANANAWRSFLWIYPELAYAIDQTYSVGLAYYSDNLTQGSYKLDSTTLSTGLSGGTTQMVFRAAL